MTGSNQDFELDDSFNEDDAPFDEESANKAVSAKDSLLKRRLIDDLLAERRLQRELKELDYDFDDDDE
ncbi:PA3496 family putative envelope integrity protein [Alkanindiges sp. WGS2144]|uniref:PA3496 family putative envelope integrity protein n=1 Tax=Alkanindiges sp. WGS2144 TaxID=3366808 RepID=UPI003752A480